MKITLKSLFAGAMLLAASAQVHAAAVLYFESGPSPDSATVALGNLGYTVTQVSSNTAFATQVATGAYDLVVIDLPHGGTDATSDTALATYINAGGRAIHFQWDPSAAIQAAFQVAVASTFSAPLDVFAWVSGDPVFNVPNSVLGLNVVQDGSGTNGQRVDPVGTAVALAGYTGAPAAGQAAMVLGNDGRTIFNAFSTEDMNTTQMVALYENQIISVLGGAASVPVPAPLLLIAAGLFFAASRKRKLG